ncbi:MAG: hypothetical protein RLP02_04415, partial [Coleofasciculus sp. C2-GNP5-27]
FGRECTFRGVPPATVQLFGSPYMTWRGVPIIPSSKLWVNEGKTNILLMRVGEDAQGVVGLHKTGVSGEQGEQTPGVSVRLMGINDRAISTYLITLYYSVACLVPDALGVLENVDTTVYHNYD